MHPWPKFKEKAHKIPNVLIELTDVKLWKSETASNLYSKISDQITGPQCKFLTGIDPLKAQQTSIRAHKEETKTTSGASITQIQQITLVNDLSDAQKLQNLTKMPSIQEADAFLTVKLGLSL